MPSGEENLFYCVTFMFYQMLQEYGKLEHRDGLTVKYGDYNWGDAVLYILSYDGKGHGGILQDYMQKYTI
jgi:hypothetical protein